MTVVAMDWIEPLIGIPFVEKGRSLAGCDCWGLVRLALARGFGLSVPDYTEGYMTTKDREEIAALMNRESIGWTEVAISEAQPGDVALFRIQGHACHAGLVIDPPVFLHCQRGIGAGLERWDSAIWRDRLSALFRYRKPTESAS